MAAGAAGGASMPPVATTDTVPHTTSSIPVIGPRLAWSISRQRLGIVAIIVAFVVLVGAVVGYVVLPSASITVRPRVDTLGPGLVRR